MPAPLSDTLLLSVHEVAACLGGGISTRSVWRRAAEDQFPPPVRIGHRTLWRRRDIETFVEVGCNMAAWQRRVANSAR